MQRAFRRVFFCVCVGVLAGAPLTAQEQVAEPRCKVRIEFWMAELDLAKLRALDLTWDHVDASGQGRTVKILDILEGKERDASLLQQPDELLTVLRGAGVARVLAQPTLVTLCGRKASLEVGGTKLEVTAQLRGEQEIAMDLRAEITQPLRRVQGRIPPGNRQFTLSTSVIVEPGKAGLLCPLGSMQLVQPAGSAPAAPALPIALLRVTRL